MVLQAKKETKVKRCIDCQSTDIYKTMQNKYLKDGKIVKETKVNICLNCYYELLGGQDI